MHQLLNLFWRQLGLGAGRLAASWLLKFRNVGGPSVQMLHKCRWTKEKRWVTSLEFESELESDRANRFSTRSTCRRQRVSGGAQPVPAAAAATKISLTG